MSKIWLYLNKNTSASGWHHYWVTSPGSGQLDLPPKTWIKKFQNILVQSSFDIFTWRSLLISLSTISVVAGPTSFSFRKDKPVSTSSSWNTRTPTCHSKLSHSQKTHMMLQHYIMRTNSRYKSSLHKIVSNATCNTKWHFHVVTNTMSSKSVSKLRTITRDNKKRWLSLYTNIITSDNELSFRACFCSIHKFQQVCRQSSQIWILLLLHGLCT